MAKSNEVASSYIWQTLLAVWGSVALLATALTLLVGTVPAHAAAPAAKHSPAGIIVSTDGETSLFRTGHISSPATRLQEVYSGDRLKTGPNGQLSVRFTDGMRMNLGPTTQLNIDQYINKPGEERSFFDLLRGSLRTITGLIGKSEPEAFRLQTPTAVIGVRGTDFTVIQADCRQTDCSSPDTAALEVSVTSGAIDVGNKAGSLVVNEGQTARIGKPGELPSLVQAPTTSPAQPVRRRKTPSAAAPTLQRESAKPAPTVRRDYNAPSASEFVAPRN